MDNPEEQDIPYHTFDCELSRDENDIRRCSRDTSIFEIRPKAVLYPKDSSHIRAIVKRISKLRSQGINTSVSVRAAGTCMSGGSLTKELILDVSKYMRRIGSASAPESNLSEGNQGEVLCITEPGVYCRDFDSFCRTRGYEMPVYPASRNLCAVGGMFANNCGGEKSLRFGKAANFVYATKHIFADGNEYTVAKLSEEALLHKMKQENFEGEIYRKVYKLIQDNWALIQKNKPRVSKNSSGYYLWNVLDSETGSFDLNQLLCGAQGTLGIASEITWKLVPTEEKRKMIVIFLPHLTSVGEIVNTLLEYHPSSVESYDDTSMKLALRYFTDFIETLGIKKSLTLGIQFIPDLGMLVSGGMPKLILVAEFTGNNETEINKRVQACFEKIKEFGYQCRIPTSYNDEEKYWTIRRESFNLLRKHLRGKRTAPFIDDVCIDPFVMPEFMPRARTLLDKYNLEYTIAGHAGNGNFHIIPLVDFSDTHTIDMILTLSEEYYTLTQEFAGSISAEHNDGIIRTPYLHYMFDNEMLKLFEEVKNIFDPLNIFNPHKKVGGTIDKIKESIITK